MYRQGLLEGYLVVVAGIDYTNITVSDVKGNIWAIFLTCN